MSNNTPFKATTTPTLDAGYAKAELKVTDRVVQNPSADKILRSYSLGGPESLRDVRMFLELADLEHLTNIALLSPTKRVVLPSAGIRMEVRQSRDGHIYEVLRITSRQPQPERVPSGLVTQQSQWKANGK